MMFNDLKKKNIIITGGLGFLGTQIVNAFFEEGLDHVDDC